MEVKNVETNTPYSMNVDLEKYIDLRRAGKFTGYIVIDDGVRSFQDHEREIITRKFLGWFFQQHRNSIIECGISHGNIASAIFEAEKDETLDGIENDLTKIVHEARDNIPSKLIAKRGRGNYDRTNKRRKENYRTTERTARI